MCTATHLFFYLEITTVVPRMECLMAIVMLGLIAQKMGIDGLYQSRLNYRIKT